MRHALSGEVVVIFSFPPFIPLSPPSLWGEMVNCCLQKLDVPGSPKEEARAHPHWRESLINEIEIFMGDIIALIL